MAITQARLKELFDYDLLTGIVTRLKCTANRHTVGEVVGTKGARGYLQATIDSKKYMLHRLIWLWVHGVWPPADVDHKNRNRADNSFDNLRLASRSENNHNAGMNRRNWSGYTGVAWDKSRCLWVAHIAVQGKQIYLGRYSDPAVGSAAYQAAKRIYHPTAPL